MFGATYNVDFNNLDEQQRYIHNRAWNDAIELAALKCEAKGLIGMKEIAIDIRKLKR